MKPLEKFGQLKTKADFLLQRKLIVALFNKEAFNGKDEFDLGVIITTGTQVKVREVKGPDISKRFKVKDYALWMPYHKIVESDDMLRSYLYHLFEGINEVFLKENISTDVIAKVKKAVEEQVLYNKDYEFVTPK